MSTPITLTPGHVAEVDAMSAATTVIHGSLATHIVTYQAPAVDGGRLLVARLCEPAYPVWCVDVPGPMTPDQVGEAIAEDPTTCRVCRDRWQSSLDDGDPHPTPSLLDLLEQP